MMKPNKNYGNGAHLTVVVALAFGLGTPAVPAGMAEVQEFIQMDEWVAAIGGEDAFTTIDFTGFPPGTVITDQYADLGVTFAEGDDTIEFNPGGFLNDGFGLDVNQQAVIVFDTPHMWIAADFPGALRFELFLNDELIYDSGLMGGGGQGFFAGLVSNTPFDTVVVSELQPHFDDLHFGGAIPAPSTLALLFVSSLVFPNRRKRSD